MRSLEASQRGDWKVFGQSRVSEPCLNVRLPDESGV
jgi:hypothetical protein